jgi:hypothetical protein
MNQATLAQNLYLHQCVPADSFCVISELPELLEFGCRMCIRWLSAFITFASRDVCVLLLGFLLLWSVPVCRSYVLLLCLDPGHHLSDCVLLPSVTKKQHDFELAIKQCVHKT